MDKIKAELVNSIKEGKWCQITYDNTEKGNTNFWIFILDINPEKKKLKVEMYNHSISEKILNTELKFEKIISAQVIEFTDHEPSLNLIEKIQKIQLHLLGWNLKNSTITFFYISKIVIN